MASPAPPAPPGAPGAGGSEGAEEALGSAAGRRRRPPLSALSAFSRIPDRREGPAELSYFHREAKTGDVSTYDSIFKRPEGYNKNLHRCDREHAKSRGLNINEEGFQHLPKNLKSAFAQKSGNVSHLTALL